MLASIQSVLMAQPTATLPWFNWQKTAGLPNKQGLSSGFTGFSGNTLLYAGGSNFSKPRWEGGQKQFHSAIYAIDHPEQVGSVWQEVGTLPHSLADGATVATDDGLLCIGGTDGITTYATVWLLRWNGQQHRATVDSTHIPALPMACSNPAATRLDDFIYVMGGKGPDGKALQTGWQLNLRNPKAWMPLPAWPGPARFGAALVAQNNGERPFLYLLSGKSDTDYLNDGYRFNPVSAQWQPIRSLPRATMLAPAIAFGPTHILLFSGSDGHSLETIPAMKSADDYRFSPKILAYHTITDTWAVVGELPRGLVGSNVLFHQNQLRLPGGEIAPSVRTADVYVGKPVRQLTRSLFGWIDYTVLLVYLALLAGISFYFSRRNKTADDFLLGGQRIPAWAAGISVMSTQVSAIGFMTIPAKSYAINWAYFAGVFTWFIAVPIVTYYFIPLIRNLRLTSVYQYLEERFDAKVRLLAASLFMLFQLARMGLVLYLPALALSSVTPLDTLVCILIMGLLSTIYTVMGGMEGVIWIEVIQALLLFCGAVLCIVLAIDGIDGGVGSFFQIATANNKLSLGQWDWSVTSSTLLVIILGNIFIRLGNLTTDQAVVQRYLTTPSTAQAQKTVWTDVWASIPWAIVVYLLGTALYVYYQQHAEKLSGTINTDGILPFFIAQNAPFGVSGLIIAGIFAASMGSSQSHIHSLATIFTTDFYARLRPIDGRKTFIVARNTTLVLGLLSTGLAITLLYLDIRSLLDFFQEVTGLFIGSSAGLFMLGMFTRRANSTGTFIGAMLSMIILYGIKQYTPLSFWLYSAVGFITCITLGFLFSCILKGKATIEGLTIYSTRSAKSSANHPITTNP